MSRLVSQISPRLVRSYLLPLYHAIIGVGRVAIVMTGVRVATVISGGLEAIAMIGGRVATAKVLAVTLVATANKSSGDQEAIVLAEVLVSLPQSVNVLASLWKVVLGVVHVQTNSGQALRVDKNHGASQVRPNRQLRPSQNVRRYHHRHRLRQRQSRSRRLRIAI
jgi:hypothetical protein